jgi:hypothetical protein
MASTREQATGMDVLLFESSISRRNREKLMKFTATLVTALAVGALAACNQSPQENKADQIEANAENTADALEANTENGADALEAAGQNAAGAIREQGENKADAVRNGADADGNSAN